MPSFTRLQLERYLNRLDVKADTVYDIGGAQKPVKGRTKTWDVKNYQIIDLEQPHEVATEPDFYCDIESSAPITISKADVIFCLEVAEYWIDPMTAIKNIFSILKTGGILYISFPFIYPKHNPVGLDCLRYTSWGARKLLETNGFEVLDLTLRTCDLFTLTDFFSMEKMRPSKDPTVDHSEVGCIIKCKKL